MDKGSPHLKTAHPSQPTTQVKTTFQTAIMRNHFADWLLAIACSKLIKPTCRQTLTTINRPNFGSGKPRTTEFATDLRKHLILHLWLLTPVLLTSELPPRPPGNQLSPRKSKRENMIWWKNIRNSLAQCFPPTQCFPARASFGLNYTCWWLSAPRYDHRGTISH